ncbi:MAG: hypothetical protein ACTSQJ_06420 [Promethearchaeota archaeon]
MSESIFGWNSWEEFLAWYDKLPFIGQFLFLVGFIALTILIGIGVYYLIKGIIFLIYYILKGIFYVIRALFFAIYKFFEEIYYLISKKTKPLKQTLNSTSINSHSIQYIEKNSYSKKIKYCSECGTEFTENMKHQLAKQGFVYCVYCGKNYKINLNLIES